MKNASMSQHPRVSMFTLMFLAFGVLGILFTSLFLVGCGESLPETPETATVKVEILTSPNPLNAAKAVAKNNPYGPVCKVGDILRPGESCFYPGTDTVFTVLNDGGLRFFSTLVARGAIMLESTVYNDHVLTFVARARADGFWEIKKVGGELSLTLIVSTDFSGSIGALIYNTKEEFAITQDFDQDFQLDPDDPRVSLAFFNGTSHTLSFRYTVLSDGEVRLDRKQLLTRGSSHTTYLD